jgi:hypothetical protein
MTMQRNLERITRTTLTILSLSGLAVLGACDDDDPVEPLPIGVVATFNDDAVNFQAMGTFAMPDTVLQFDPLSGVPAPVTRQFDQTILDRVRLNFVNRGYVEVDPTVEQPDFVVLVGTTAADEYDAWVGYAWYGEWGFYNGWGWYTPGFAADWDIIYPWYPVVGVTSYRRGTIVVDLIPTLSVNPLQRTVRSAWAGVASGALIDGTVTATNITNGIDQMFAQSPYLVSTSTTVRRGRAK